MPYVPRVLTNGTDERTPASAEEDAQLVWEGWYPLADAPPIGTNALDTNVAALVDDAASLTRTQLELYFEAFVDRTGTTPGQVLTLIAGGATAWQDAGGAVDSVNGATGVVVLDADDIADGTTKVLMTPAERTKLTGVATGATANATDAQLRDRSTHTGTQVAATLSDLTETVQDIVAAFLVAGTNVTVSYNDVANTFTINSTGGGGTTDAEVVRDTIGGALVAGAGITITVNDAGDTITIASTAVLPTRQVNSGTGLSGGGDLSANRTLAVAYGTTAATAAEGNDTRIVNAVPNTRTITAGTGLTGGGTLAADRALAVAYGTTAGTATQGNDSRLSAASTTASGIVELADDTEATAGSSNAVVMTPARSKLARRQSITARTAAHTAAAADVEKLITMTHAAAAAVTLPSDANDAGIAIGDWIEYIQLGAGQTTFTAGAGVGALVVPAGATAACRGTNCRVVVQKIAANTYALAGDLA